MRTYDRARQGSTYNHTIDFCVLPNCMDGIPVAQLLGPEFEERRRLLYKLADATSNEPGLPDNIAAKATIRICVSISSGMNFAKAYNLR